MQYFLGYPGFISEKPFDASLFVEIRKRLSLDVMNAINEAIVQLMTCFGEKAEKANRNSEVSATHEPLEKGDTHSGKQAGQAETEASVPNAPLEKSDTHTDKTSNQVKVNVQSELSATNAPLEKGDSHPCQQSGQPEPPVETATGEETYEQKDKPSGQAAPSGSSDHTEAVETKEDPDGQPPCLPDVQSEVTHKGILLLDATVCPQDTVTELVEV